MDNLSTVRILTYAGALPFVAFALLPLAGVGSVAPLGPLDAVAASYGLGILSFIAGTHWAFQLLRKTDTPFDLSISSNVAFLAVFISWLVAPLSWALSIQALVFAFLMYVDRELAARGITSRDYLQIRYVATSAAIVSLLVIVLAH